MSQLFCFSLAREFDQSGQEFPLKIPIKFSSPEKLNPILHGGGGGWIPPLLTLVLNSVSGIQAIVLMFGDFS